LLYKLNKYFLKKEGFLKYDIEVYFDTLNEIIDERRKFLKNFTKGGKF